MGKKFLSLSTLISKEIQGMIQEGRYKTGDRLPSERELAELFGVQRLTVRSALQVLQQKGIIGARERSGYYVTPARITVDLDALKSTQAIIRDAGSESFARLLEFEKTEVTERLARKMGVAIGTRIYKATRLRYVEDVPISLERAYMIRELVEDMSEEDLHNNSIYTTFKNKFNIHVGHSNVKVTMVYANGLEAELLKVSLKKPLMKYQGLVYDKQKRLIEYFEDIMLMDRYQFVAVKGKGRL